MSQIQAIKEANDIISVIGERINLQRSGGQYRGLCPFHSEKSPSFFVNEQMQRYKCFGCGEAGDVFTFLEKYEGMSFAESLEYLAEKAGITLEKFQSNPEDELQKDVLAVLNLTAEYYHFLLTKHKAGKTALDYIKNRGINNESVNLFKLGCSLDEWDGLLKYLYGKKKFSLHIIEKAGLIIKGKNGYYDRFRGRLMYPLRDHRGRVVGFSGRVLDPTVKDAKYLNTPETMVYHKSKLLYGYHELYRSIRKEEEVLVTEGEMDVISASQASVNHIVAIKGSSLTVDHAKLLSRTVKRVVLALDGDSAGVKATKRAITVLNTFNDIELRVMTLPEGKDIDDLARSNPKFLRESAKRSVTAYEFLINRAFIQNDKNEPAGKSKIIKELWEPILDWVKLEVEREHYIGFLSEEFGVSKNQIRKDLEQAKIQASLVKRKQTITSIAHVVAPESFTGRQNLERELLFILLKDESLLAQRIQQLVAIEMADVFVKQIVVTIHQKNTFDIKSLSRYLSAKIQDELVILMSDMDWNNIYSTSDPEVIWSKRLEDYKLEVLKDDQKRISEELSELDTILHKTEEQEKYYLSLLVKMNKLNKQLKVINNKK